MEKKEFKWRTLINEDTDRLYIQHCFEGKGRYSLCGKVHMTEDFDIYDDEEMDKVHCKKCFKIYKTNLPVFS